jgi:hypothetical protein
MKVGGAGGRDHGRQAAAAARARPGRGARRGAPCRLPRPPRPRPRPVPTPQGVDVDPDHLTVTAGAGAIVDLLFHAIASAGDGAAIGAAGRRRGPPARAAPPTPPPPPPAPIAAPQPRPHTRTPTPSHTPGVLIPAPYYPAFDNDLSVRNQVEPIPLHLRPGAPLAPQLDAAAAAAAGAGHPVRALLVSNPSNPLGTVVPEAELEEMLAWCLVNEVHFVRCGPGGGTSGVDSSLWRGALLGPGRAGLWAGRHLGAAPCPRLPSFFTLPNTAAPQPPPPAPTPIPTPHSHPPPHPAPPPSDEIYALSVFGEGGPPFVSAEVIARRAAAAGGSHSGRIDDLVRGRGGRGWRRPARGPTMKQQQRHPPRSDFKHPFPKPTAPPTPPLTSPPTPSTPSPLQPPPCDPPTPPPTPTPNPPGSRHLRHVQGLLRQRAAPGLPPHAQRIAQRGAGQPRILHAARSLHPGAHLGGGRGACVLHAARGLHPGAAPGGQGARGRHPIQASPPRPPRLSSPPPRLSLTPPRPHPHPHPHTYARPHSGCLPSCWATPSSWRAT